jgi:hypothetical protein
MGGGDNQYEGQIPMDTETSPRGNARVVISLVVLGIAVVVGAVGLWFGGSFLFQFLARPVSLPLWCIALLAVGPAVLVGGGILWLWSTGHKRGEMERRPIVVKGVRWRWWTQHDGSLRVVPYCEACDLQLRPREASAKSAADAPGFVLHCNSCDQETERYQGSLEDAPQLILDHFMQNLRKEFELAPHHS